MEKAKSKRDAAKEEKKDSKLEEQILKTLDQNAPVESRFQALLQKQVESEREVRRLKTDMKSFEKQFDVVTREKDHLQKELNRSVLIREKLNEVAREQQKMIKTLKYESMQQLKLEEDRRKESQQKFQNSLEEISQSLNKNNEENIKLRDYNIEMTKKLKFLAEQYQSREQQLEKINEQIALENQIHVAKLNKVQVQAAMEKEILSKEKQIALEKLLRAEKCIKDMSEREQSLKEQLNLYTTKYDDFQSSLQKSNDIFATYKTELEKMSKNTRKLEKEALEWKRRWEKSNATLIELATEKKERDEHAIRCNKQVEQLQKLLRAFQNERTHLYKVIRENNIECPAVPQLPPEPEPMKTTPINDDKDKLEIMSKNCADLKQSLATLHNQMKILTNVEQATKNEQLKQQEDAMLKKKQKRQKQRLTKEKNNQELKEKQEAEASSSLRSLSKQASEETESTTNSIDEKSATLNGEENCSATVPNGEGLENLSECESANSLKATADIELAAQDEESEAPTTIVTEGEAVVVTENEAVDVTEKKAADVFENEAPVMTENEAPVMTENEAPVIMKNDVPAVNENVAPAVIEKQVPVETEKEISVETDIEAAFGTKTQQQN